VPPHFAASRIGANASSDAPEAGARVGSFELVRRLGHGGSGHVYLARDHLHGGWVALKVLSLAANGADASARQLAAERFVREAQAARQFRHPGLVVVLDAGCADGQGWIAMELAHGVDLTRYADARRLLPPAAVAGIGQRVARALGHVHAHGVIHRDVKPANIIVDWPRDDVKLVDFGVAHWNDHARTRSGQTLGSPQYMAPEQLAGAEIGPAADLYALGVTLYELLAGARPYTAPTLGALLRAVAHDAAPDLASRRPDLPPGLCRVVMALLEKAPGRRTADADALAENLGRFSGRAVDGGVRSPTA
jgi:serine/threonine-protein kinase